MARQENPNIRYTFLSKNDLSNIDRGLMQSPSWTCTKTMIIHSIANKVLNKDYIFRLNRKRYYCVGAFNTEINKWKTFIIYDDKGFVTIGSLGTVMEFFNIDSITNYYDITNIEHNNAPLFLEIYKANVLVNTKVFTKDMQPQQLADYTLNEALKGVEWARKVLLKPENPIKTVCKREGLTRPQLAKKIGVKLTLLENYISRDTCTPWLIAVLREYYNYI